MPHIYVQVQLGECMSTSSLGEESGWTLDVSDLQSQHLLMVDWKIIAGRKHSGIKTKHIITVSTGYHCILDKQIAIILSVLPQTATVLAHSTKHG